ncbi:Myrrcad domain-containing protein [Mycoplasma feriruminatoris]|uniref:Myrrcad domain-containing protein n=1 Tax=Mycoplasma feriruminatoris TaxID=1179777 RepID=A0ABY8HUH8_9MOLU|nr:Myrrcad domain-containing protein [Mycoplasma feriruminatoris]
MKKLLTILTTTSAAFLMSVGLMLVNTNNSKNVNVSYNAITYIQRHKTNGSKLIEIGYYKSGNKFIIEQIPTTVTVIAAELPKQITSLRTAFVGSRNNIT